MNRQTLLTAALLSGVLVTVAGAAVVSRSNTARSAILNVADHDDAHPGPDSLRVASLLNAFRTSDPIVCELIADRIGNSWGNHDDGVGRFDDARAKLDAAKDSINGRIENSGTIALLVSSLDAEDPCVRRVAAEWLGRSTVNVTTLVARLSDKSSRIRAAAAYAIGVGHERVGTAARGDLEQLLRSASATDGAMAAWALGELEDSSAVPALLQALKSAHVAVRVSAIDALSEIEDDRSVKDLERVLKNDVDDVVRAHAAEALGNHGDASSLAVLADALSDRSPRVRYAAVEAMDDVHDNEIAPPALVAATKSSDAKLQRLAAMVLAEIHDPNTIDALISLASHSDHEVRQKVAEALGEIGSAKASSSLMKMLKDSDPEVRRAAAEALGEIRP